jgi:hypothetical protein
MELGTGLQFLDQIMTPGWSGESLRPFRDGKIEQVTR